MALKERIVELDEDQARSDHGNTLESRPLQDEDQAGSNPEQSHVALAGPNPKPMYEDFIATVYPQVHESLKHPDEFSNDKPTKEEPDKANVETKGESMVTVLIIRLFTATTTTTTTTLPPPPQQQSTIESALAARVTALE
ncbi:hypothetical protein Tco_0823203 [Tanacetum coccineum]|uniref:Uncharacterized protein n=1 Tax=Tanacetum coccineum TaxID=301880 RepID=A0ABQ5AM63_9ASTR